VSNDPKILTTLDTEIQAEQNSWADLPDGFRLQIQTAPNHELLLDDLGNFLLIQ
jgi:hypothetical protein